MTHFLISISGKIKVDILEQNVERRILHSFLFLDIFWDSTFEINDNDKIECTSLAFIPSDKVVLRKNSEPGDVSYQ